MSAFDVRKREFFLQLFLLLLLTAVGAKAFYLAGPGREECLLKGREIALERGSIPAPRGRILDSASVPIAWSEKYYDLYYDPRTGVTPGEELLRRMIEILPRVTSALPLLPGNVSSSRMIAEAITPAELEMLSPILKSCGALQLKSRVARLFGADPRLRKLAGSVAGDENHNLHGVSGLEAEYDRELSGTPGRYEVILDRNRNWILSSWKLISAPVSGTDVKLNRSVEQLLEAAL